MTDDGDSNDDLAGQLEPTPGALSILRERALQKIVGSVERARVLVIADHESPRRPDRRLGARNRRRVEGSRDGNQEAGSYAAAGATDLVFGFADFPATRMIEAFAERVLPGLATHR